jgi:hypothetical protein
MAKISKKAVFFSIVSIFIVILFVTSTQLVSEFRIGETELEVTRTRVKILNSIMNDMEEVYFDKIIYIASKNALIGLSKYYADNNFNSDDYEYDLWEALNMTIKEGIYVKNGNIVNLTYDGCGFFNNEPCMNYDYTVNGIIKHLSDLFDTIGMDVSDFTIEIKPSYVKQADPWHIEIIADIDYHFRDKSKIASWKGLTTRKVNVSVYGLYASPNEGVITSSWKRDLPQYTELSLIRKLAGKKTIVPSDYGLGICPENADCDIN